MTVELHLSELERRHKALEREIEDAMQHPGTDDLTVSELKRRKLLLKDEIARLKQADAPVH
ncbi:MAG: YdcH family protein [Alphaproteobacteria bacterium]